MKPFIVSQIACLLLCACSIGVPSNVAIGIGGGNHNFGLGTSIYFPIKTKPIPAEPPAIAGTEKSSPPTATPSASNKKHPAR